MPAKHVQDTSKDASDKVQVEMAKVEMEFPGMFRLIYVTSSPAKSAKICCHSCNTLLSLLPERGNVIKNAQTHLSVHGDSEGKPSNIKKQSSLEMFLNVSHKEKEMPSSS